MNMNLVHKLTSYSFKIYASSTHSSLRYPSPLNSVHSVKRVSYKRHHEISFDLSHCTDMLLLLFYRSVILAAQGPDAARPLYIHAYCCDLNISGRCAHRTQIVSTLKLLCSTLDTIVNNDQ
jgi:hypothetical protein